VGNVFFSRGREEVCKGGVQLIVHSQQSEVFLEFYASFLELLFKETTYEAETLRLEADYSDEDRISISLFGFSDTVSKLLAQMAPQLSTIHHA
jgi:secreted Zn-dependent insulinase-like peptidase